MNIEKILRTVFLVEHLRWLLLVIRRPHATVYYCECILRFKDIHKAKAPSNKTPVLTKSIKNNTWIVGKSNQLFVYS